MFGSTLLDFAAVPLCMVRVGRQLRIGIVTYMSSVPALNKVFDIVYNSLAAAILATLFGSLARRN